MDAHTAKIITCNVHSVVMSSCLFFFYYAKFRKKLTMIIFASKIDT